MKGWKSHRREDWPNDRIAEWYDEREKVLKKIFEWENDKVMEW